MMDAKDLLEGRQRQNTNKIECFERRVNETSRLWTFYVQSEVFTINIMGLNRIYMSWCNRY
jgi:hypothetical protein